MSKKAARQFNGSGVGTFTDWRQILRDYDSRHAGNEAAELEWYAGQPSFAAAIELAGRAIDRFGKRSAHQCLIRKEAIPAATAALLNCERELAVAASFHDLLRVVERAVLPIFGIGPLYSYDAALRIGSHRQLFPDRVYLHAGTTLGARVLGAPRGRKWLFPSELPEELSGRAPHEVENIFCIYAGAFAHLRKIIGSQCGKSKHRNRRPTTC